MVFLLIIFKVTQALRDHQLAIILKPEVGWETVDVGLHWSHLQQLLHWDYLLQLKPQRLP
jgi:hypothetical protein